MPRKPRLHFPNALYHVIARGNRKQSIFLSNHDFKKFLQIVLKIKRSKPFILYAYCLMNNHAHLLIEVNSIPLAKIMQHILTSYARYFNLVYDKSGHLFQGRYKCILCSKQSYLLELVRYIHLNPVRAQLVKNPSDWPWSGHHHYIGNSNDPLIDGDLILECFHPNKSAASTRYKEFLQEGLSAGHREELYPQEQNPYLGDEKFTETINKEKSKLVRNSSYETKPSSPSLEHLLEIFSANVNFSPTAIRGTNRLKAIVRARKDFILKAFMEGHNTTNIARFINRDQTYVSKIIGTYPQVSRVSRA